MRRPMPGQPPAKVQTRRCNRPSAFRAYGAAKMGGRAESWRRLPYFRRVLQIDDSASEANRNRMSAIIRAKFGKYVAYVTLDSRFADGKLIRNQFVRITRC